ncbi:ribonuclease P protein component [Cohnella thailandensis]|uniref:Ribonuclease P protein component n=1 Tax=Cohnella thailandensis TaxID=557557 RepID=A0A841SWN4_9BACL|nr:ribonuclease P protein component [Cohnella thailandensis]MBP1972471.1 ribonuclease P protein component [Cohnella thailandensis]
MQRKLRLRNRDDFNRIYRQGQSFANSQFVVYWRKWPETEQFRLGISASSKLGGAVVRNRLRRMIKEIVRLNAGKINNGLDLILIVRKPALNLSYLEMEKSVLHVLRKAGLTKGSPPPVHKTYGKRPSGGGAPKNSGNRGPRAFLCL